jgi:hypothetical protein
VITAQEKVSIKRLHSSWKFLSVFFIFHHWTSYGDLSRLRSTVVKTRRKCQDVMAAVCNLQPWGDELSFRFQYPLWEVPKQGLKVPKTVNFRVE